MIQRYRIEENQRVIALLFFSFAIIEWICGYLSDEILIKSSTMRMYYNTKNKILVRLWNWVIKDCLRKTFMYGRKSQHKTRPSRQYMPYSYNKREVIILMPARQSLAIVVTKLVPPLLQYIQADRQSYYRCTVMI